MARYLGGLKFIHPHSDLRPHSYHHLHSCKTRVATIRLLYLHNVSRNVLERPLAVWCCCYCYYCYCRRYCRCYWRVILESIFIFQNHVSFRCLDFLPPPFLYECCILIIFSSPSSPPKNRHHHFRHMQVNSSYLADAHSPPHFFDIPTSMYSWLERNRGSQRRGDERKRGRKTCHYQCS